MKKNLVTLLLFACHFITTQALERAIINTRKDPEKGTITAHLHLYQDGVFHDLVMTKKSGDDTLNLRSYKSSLKAGAQLADLNENQLGQIIFLLTNALAKVA